MKLEEPKTYLTIFKILNSNYKSKIKIKNNFLIRNWCVIFLQYLLLGPFVIRSWYMLVKDESERDITAFMILPFLLWRVLHNQIWITLSRHRNAKGNARILHKGIEFDQVDRETNWLVSSIKYNLLLVSNTSFCIQLYTVKLTYLVNLVSNGPVMDDKIGLTNNKFS